MLLARNAAWSSKMFALVTGFLERDESPRDAIEREVKEETALVATRTELIGVYDFPRRNQVIIAYHVVAEGEVRCPRNSSTTSSWRPPTCGRGRRERARAWPTGCARGGCR